MKFDMAHTRPSSIAKHKRKAAAARKSAATVKSGAHSRNAALRELARRYPDKEEVGYMWKDPRAKTTRTRRWTIRDLKKFREYQKEEKSLKDKNTWWFF